MKKKLSVISILFISILIYSCCKDKTYNSSIGGLSSRPDKDSTSKWNKNTAKIYFEIDQKIDLISNINFINESKADGFGGAPSCGSSNINNYNDPIDTITYTCDKEIVGFGANEILNTITNFEIDYIDSLNCLNFKNHLNTTTDNYYRRFNLSIPVSYLLKEDFHTFTLSIKTVSGKEFVAKSKPIYWRK